jgi:hypothetical protein
MPKYDLAGNPLPETDSSQPPRPSGPGSSLPPRTDPQGRPIHAAPPPSAAPLSGAPSSGSVKYDLAGNPIPGSAPPPPAAGNWSGAPVPGAQPQGAQGAWPPTPTPYGQYGNHAANDTGMKGSVPPEIAALKWNWGAFVLTWLWCFNHRMIGWGVGILLASLLIGWIPGGVLLILPFAIYFGVKGHQLGWQNRQFSGVSEFFSVESAWMKWGVGLFVLNLAMAPILAAILFPVFAQARNKARMMSHQSGYSQPYANPSVPAGSGQ